VAGQEGLDFAGWLAALRNEAGLTQEELARRAGLSSRAISDLERQIHRTARKATAGLLADALGLAGRERERFVGMALGKEPAATNPAGQPGPIQPGPVQPGPAPPGSTPPAEPLEVRCTLPPDVAAFTGRDAELDQIIAAVRDMATADPAVTIHTIGGMPGVGKTALAVHAAHLLRDQFPDRQLFIDLHGHTPGQVPVSAASALASLLAAIGVGTRQLPADLESLAGLWRDRMAGERAVLVLDNAASSRQVAPLLPGGRHCLVLLTSRRHLGDLLGPVAAVPLQVPPAGEAREMFLRLAPGVHAGPEVTELVRLAGFLPLAISLLARVLARHRSWTLANLAAETRASMLTLAAEDDSIEAVFEVSCRDLAPGQQQLLRQLGVHPGTTIDSYAAAALTGTGLPEATACLDALHREGLLTEDSYRRYSMHDLIRRYARVRAAAGPIAEREQALDRLLDFYTRTAATAESRLARQTRTVPAPAAAAATVPELFGSAQALAWLRAERGNLLACLDQVTEAGQHARVITLTAALAALLRQDGPWADAIGRHTAAVHAAQQCGDRLGQAGALANLGIVRRLTGDYTRAAQAQQEALDLYRTAGNRLGQANAWHQLGAGRRMTADYAGAAQAQQEALDLYRGVGDRHGQANALNELGAVWRMTGDYLEAARAQQEALDLYCEVGDQFGQANALNYLGAVWQTTGDYQGAVRAHEQAYGISRELGHQHGQANALNFLGSARQLAGDYLGAAHALQEALDISRELGHRHGQANALNELGVVLRITGDHPGAARALEEALALFQDLGDQGGEVIVLNELGALCRVRGDGAQAGKCHRQALDLARAIDSSFEEARSLAGLGRCALDAGHSAEARSLLEQARAIFHRIGAVSRGQDEAIQAVLKLVPGALSGPG
jgi:tetratricopeptide (TPR) repeat protein